MEAWLCTSIRAGFPLLSDTPIAHRYARDAVSDAQEPDVMWDVMKGFISFGAIREWPFQAQLTHYRATPFFGVPKPDGTTRGIVDCSAGKGSVNEHTSRLGHWPSRLANIPRVLQRINYMRRTRPTVRIMAFKLDIVKAFLQCPNAERDFFRLGVRILMRYYVHSGWLAVLWEVREFASRAFYYLSIKVKRLRVVSVDPPTVNTTPTPCTTPLIAILIFASNDE